MSDIQQQIIDEALRLAERGENPNVQPCILANYNIDPRKILECTSCYVNDSWAAKLKELLEQGFIIFRIQTELSSIGHHTMAYLAKLKSDEPAGMMA